MFDELCREALDAFNRIIGLDLTKVAIDGSQHEAHTAAKEPGHVPLIGANSATSGPSESTGT